MVNFGAKNVSNFYFDFQSLFPQNLIRLYQKTLLKALNNKTCYQKNPMPSCLKIPYFIFIFRGNQTQKF